MGMMHSQHAPEAAPLDEEAQRLLERLLTDPRAERVTARRLTRIVEVAQRRLASVTVVLENLYDPHNASAVVRTAEGFGLDAVHVVETPNRFAAARSIVRGADRWVRIERHARLARCLGELAARGFFVCAADVGPGCVPLEDLSVGRPIALVFGSEHDGLSRRAKGLADARFTIPMHGFTGSFNVSVSAAIAIHDVARRRRARLKGAGDLDVAEREARVERWLERAAGRRPPRTRGSGSVRAEPSS